MEFCKIVLLIPVTEQWSRPDKTDWQKLTDHEHEVLVLGTEYLQEDELPATPDVLYRPGSAAFVWHDGKFVDADEVSAAAAK